MELSHLSVAQLQEYEQTVKYQLRLTKAHDSLLTFTQMTMPDPNNPDDPTATCYEITPQAELLAKVLERIESGQLKRAAVSIGPQLGKSELISRRFPAWSQGRNPRRNFMLGTYNQPFAEEFGGEVRGIFGEQRFKQIFPNFALKKGSQAKDLLITEQGGKMAFVGVGGSGSGKPSDIFVIDDPIKNEEEANSQVFRDRLWGWFNKVVLARCHKDSAIVIVHTRWHEDDLIGRLCDPDHPERLNGGKYAGLEDEWVYINIPAVIHDPVMARKLGLTLKEPTSPIVIKQFGSKPVAALWENRKSAEFLAKVRRTDARTYDALYAGKPAPDDGDYFTQSMLVEYNSPHEMPDKLRWYGASDCALTLEARRDENVHGCAGVDEDNNIWIPPDIVWDRMQSDRIVEEMLQQMRIHKPDLWWAEADAIGKSIGPFLYARMREEHVYCTVVPVRPTQDKVARARSIQARMSMQMVHFPAFAPWWPKAKAQLLKFPYAAHDDFVDWLAWIGLGLATQVGPGKRKEDDAAPVPGTFAWMKWAAQQKNRQDRLNRARRGF